MVIQAGTVTKQVARHIREGLINGVLHTRARNSDCRGASTNEFSSRVNIFGDRCGLEGADCRELGRGYWYNLCLRGHSC